MSTGRIVATLFMFSAAAFAGPQLTTIQDTLYKADGTRMNATAVFTWNSFDASDGTSVGMQTKTVQIVNGIFFVQLAPSTSASPAQPYTVTYSSDGKNQYQETWMVPSSTQALKVRDVRTSTTTNVPGSGSGNVGTGGVVGPISQSNVTGLVQDLAARPVKGVGYGPGRVALVDSNGAISTVVGNLSDCVYADGSAGPCFDPGNLPNYSDSEAPAGVVDGANVTFGLAATPTPAVSLLLFRNGLVQKPGLDYTLSGKTVTFLANNAPQPGDTIMAWYRMPALLQGAVQSSSLSAANLNALAPLPVSTPQVICSANGAQTTNASTTSMGTCTLPANLLASGDRVEIRFLYAHTGTASNFNYGVKWGSTQMVQRAGGTNDVNISGTADGAVATSTTLSGETFGTVLPAAKFIVPAPDATASPIKIDFHGSLATVSTDKLSLVNYTVIRYPAVSNP
jgi:hypothetical protein